MQLNPVLHLLALPLLPFLAPSQVAAQHFCVSEEAVLVAADAQNLDGLGKSSSFDGERVVLGTPHKRVNGTSMGAAYVFTERGAGWYQEAKLLAGDGAELDGFGTSVAIQGDTLIVGAPGHESGAAYVYFRQAGAWTQQAKLTSSDSHAAQEFGASVALDGDTAAIGAPHPNGGHPGTVHVFLRQGGAWILQVKLVDPTPPGLHPHEFGASVGISGDTLVVGEPSGDVPSTSAGAAVVYGRLGSSWAQEATFTGLIYKDHLGSSVAIDGDRIVAGAPGPSYSSSPGYALVCRRESTGWDRQDLLAPPGVLHGDQFGLAVAVSGNAIVVGAPRSGIDGLPPGSAYAYLEVGPRWVQAAQLLPASGGGAYEAFGSSTALSGERCVVGHPGAPGTGHTQGSGHVIRVPRSVGEFYCTCASGPCGNAEAGAGCKSSTGRGALLVAYGQTNPDRVTLHARQVVPGAFALFFQADGPVQVPFGDGLLCASGGRRPLQRIPLRADADGQLSAGACPGDPPLSILGGVVPGSGVTKYYQLWYRDAGGPCGSSFNLSNGHSIPW